MVSKYFSFFVYTVVLFCEFSCSPKNRTTVDIDTDSTTDTDKKNDSDSTILDTDSNVINRIIDTDAPREVKWISVNVGSFVFGSLYGTPCRSAYAEDEVNVTLTHNFVIAETEVTQFQWKQAGLELPIQHMVGSNFPITRVNFYDVLLFCNALSEKEGLDSCYNLSSCTGDFASGCPVNEPPENGCGCIADDCSDAPEIYFCANEIHKYENWYECPGYRLPTTAEWEYAAKAGTTTTTYNGDVFADEKYLCHEQPVLEDIAWYCNNSNDQLHPVAWKQPNPWGLYDMLGNVSEWVDYFTDGESLDYMDGHPGEDLIDPIGRTSGTSKDIRGFEFRSIGCRVRASRQNPQTPDVRGIFTGFRPVRTLFE